MRYVKIKFYCLEYVFNILILVVLVYVVYMEYVWYFYGFGFEKLVYFFVSKVGLKVW